jgi:hypothetical protein
MAAARSVERVPLLVVLLVAALHATPAAAAPDSTSADSAASRRVVRRFPEVEVRAALHDPSSSETVHLIPAAAMRTLAVDGFAQMLALQPGVVVQGEELHVRGGRAGETVTTLDGFTLNEPQRHRAMELPLLGLRSADLVSGAPEAQFVSGLAGLVDVHGADPDARPTLAWRWQSALGTRWYDRWSARAGTPLGLAGLGMIGAVDAAFDDSWLPDLRRETHVSALGIPFLWREDNRVSGWIKLAPVARPQAVALQWLVNRRVQRPYDPAWTSVVRVDPVGTPGLPGYQPGYVAYSAADHLDVTDERQDAAILSASRLGRWTRLGGTLGWMRSRSITSLDGTANPGFAGALPVFAADSFHVVGGNEPYYRLARSDVLAGRLDFDGRRPTGNQLRAGAGMSWEDVSLDELDIPYANLPFDVVRAYHAWAPGGFAYTQGRWVSGGMVLNVGLRADYWTPGPEGRHQTLPWDGRGTWSLSPRLGIAYPISAHDAFSLAYVRLHQAPDRDVLYDHRQAILNRHPLGNPALTPAEMLSYEAGVKHAFDARRSLQGAVFYRDLYASVGVRNHAQKGIPDGVAYVSGDDGHAGGFEWTFAWVRDERTRVDVQYTFLQAWGLESRPEGDPYVPAIDSITTPTSPTPLSWDRRHALAVSFTAPWRDLFVAWSTSVGSPLPWTPKPIRAPLDDLGLVNSRRLGWTETTNVNLQWTLRNLRNVTVGLEARNLFDHRGDQLATVDGYPNPVINTVYDDYGAYRTDTGNGGGAIWRVTGPGRGTWIPIGDPRLGSPPRSVRLSVGAEW